MSDQLDRRLEFASTIPSAFYTERDVLSAEQRNIFATTWQFAGSVEKVREPGQFFTIETGGEPLPIVRGNDRMLRAMSNVCRHRAGPVAKGEGKRPVLQCGYHGWTYGLDGQLKVTPEFDGVECFERSSVALPQFRIEEWHGLLFVNLDPAASPLADFLHGLPGDMPQHDHSGFRLAARKEWDVGCNWKVYVDNYLEGYHIPIVHPGLFRELDYPNYRTETKKNYSIQFAPTKRADRIRTTSQNDEVRYFWVFPNLVDIHGRSLLTAARERRASLPQALRGADGHPAQVTRP